MFLKKKFLGPANWRCMLKISMISLALWIVAVISKDRTLGFLTEHRESSSSMMTENMNTTIGDGMKSSAPAGGRLLRVIVLTYNRAASLAKLLASLDNLHLMQGDNAVLEIWVDRSRQGNVNNATLHVASKFRWTLGQSHINVHAKHVGIYGQWLTTWHPGPGSRDVALILEDDMTVSPYAYLWLRAAHDQYDQRPDISGYTLQSEGVNIASGRGPLVVNSSQNNFAYHLLGSWGFSPHADRWRELQQWYTTTSRDSAFKPYVGRASMLTSWYKNLETQNKADTMWTMWHVYFSDKNKLYCVYNNLARYTGKKNTMLAVNRREKGLHFGSKQHDNLEHLLNFWDTKYVDFSKGLHLYDWNGHRV